MGKPPQIYHTFALFDQFDPPKMGNSMTPWMMSGGKKGGHWRSRFFHLWKKVHKYHRIPNSGSRSQQIAATWKIIPGLGSVAKNHGDRNSPRPGVVGPVPNGSINDL